MPPVVVAACLLEDKVGKACFGSYMQHLGTGGQNASLHTLNSASRGHVQVCNLSCCGQLHKRSQLMRAALGFAGEHGRRAKQEPVWLHQNTQPPHSHAGFLSIAVGCAGERSRSPASCTGRPGHPCSSRPGPERERGGSLLAPQQVPSGPVWFCGVAWHVFVRKFGTVRMSWCSGIFPEHARCSCMLLIVKASLAGCVC